MKNKYKKVSKKIKNSLKDYFKFLDKNKSFNLMEVIAIMIITVIFGMFAGGILMYRKGALNFGIKKELNEFVDTYTEILNEYYTDVSEDGLLEAGINGMVNYLGDPYSVFMDKETSIAFNEKVNGEYVGIGVEIAQYSDLKVEIMSVNEKGPSYKAGLMVGDILKKVDNIDITEKEISEITSLVKGERGTTVKITVLRGDEEKTFDVKREAIDIESVHSEVIDYNDAKIGYIAIDLFASNVYPQFKSNLEKIEKEKIDSLVIDVRGNVGGYLSTVNDVLSLFLKKGELIYQLKTKDKVEKFYDKTDEYRDYKICVLTNSGSASASELLTAAIHDTYKGITVGTTTYGKSKVQKTQDLSNGRTIKYTFQEWLTPNGESVGDKGITPDYEVTYAPENENTKYDSQLQKALDLLTNKEEATSEN